MCRLLRLALLVVATTLACQAFAGTPTALGASSTATQNPEITVSLSLPDQASVGETVAATITIVNNTPKIESIVVQGVWTDPEGEATVTTRNGLLLPGQKVTRVVDYVVDESCVAGTHEVTINVQSRSGTSSATAAIEVI
jgi:hypothetical protein